MKVLFVGSHLDKGGGQALQTLQLFRTLRNSVEGTYLCLRAGGAHAELLEQEGVRVVGTLRMPQGIWDLRAAIIGERGDWDVVQVFDVYFGLPATFLARAFPRAVLFGTDPITEVGWRYGPSARTVAGLGLPPLLRDTTLVVNSPALAEIYLRFSPTFIPNGLHESRFDAPRRKLRRADSWASIRRPRSCSGWARSSTPSEWNGCSRPCARSPTLSWWPWEVTTRNISETGTFGSSSPSIGMLRRGRPFRGRFRTSRISLYLAAADVFAFPSRFEGMPNAVMEAMAAGLPVVASDIPAHHALIRSGESGYLASDPDVFATRISALLSDHELAMTVGLRGREAMRGE